MAIRSLARWALYLNQLISRLSIEGLLTIKMQMLLGRLPLGEDELFDEEESAGDVDVVCVILTLTFQMGTLDPATLQKETARDAVIPQVTRFTREGWPQKNNDVDVEKYRKVAASLSTLRGCLLYGTKSCDSEHASPSNAQTSS